MGQYRSEMVLFDLSFLFGLQKMIPRICKDFYLKKSWHGTLRAYCRKRECQKIFLSYSLYKLRVKRQKKFGQFLTKNISFEILFFLPRTDVQKTISRYGTVPALLLLLQMLRL